MIPRHHTGLDAADFAFFLKEWARSTGTARVEGLFDDRFEDHRLLATPLGRHALWYFLKIVDLPPGSEVLVGGFNFYLVVRLLVQRGLRPVFVDIERDTLCMDPDDLARKVTPRSRLVVVTHTFGHSADMTRICEVAQQSGLLLFEDCAHAMGTRHAGRQVGLFGDGALFSFGIHKLITAFSGGMLVLRPGLGDDFVVPEETFGVMEARLGVLARAVAAWSMRPGVYRWSYGPLSKLANAMAAIGMPQLLHVLIPARDNPDYRFTTSSGRPFMPYKNALLRRQLDRLPEHIARRRRHVRRLFEQLEDVPQVELLQPARHGEDNGSYTGFHVPDPDGLHDALARAGVDSGVRQFLDCGALEQFSEFAAELPESSRAQRSLIRVPSYADLSDAEVDHIAAVVRRWAEASASDSAR